VELERLERELELWLWSWNGWSAHKKVRTLLHFLACLLALLQRCFAATQQAPEPGSGALLRVALLRVALPRVALLRLALLRLRSFAARCFAVAPELCCALLCCN
jgi:hypothetical protein